MATHVGMLHQTLQSRQTSPMRFKTRTISLAIAGLIAMPSLSQAAPQIRLNGQNKVPACVTPDRLMVYLRSRNPQLLPQFRNIADHYQHWGEAWRVRWDYAFYQMIIETNALKFRRGDGRRGDVHESQNNFAGIGATGGGVPGDRFPDVSTGVHAQIQHLVTYSGVPIRRPIAPRTAKVQDHIVSLSRRLGRPVTFADLAKRWAVDPAYWRSISTIAAEYEGQYCRGGRSDSDNAAAITAPQPRPVRRRSLAPFPMPSGLGGPTPEPIEVAIATPEPDAASEALPWTPNVTAPEPVSRLSAPPARTAQNWSEPRPFPVRTIWSRDDAIAQPAQGTGAQVVAVTDTNTHANTTTDKGLSFFDFATGGLFGGAGQDGNRPAFSWFQIGPSEPEPSRLGGPVPDPQPREPLHAHQTAIVEERTTVIAKTRSWPAAVVTPAGAAAASIPVPIRRPQRATIVPPAVNANLAGHAPASPARAVPPAASTTPPRATIQPVALTPSSQITKAAIAPETGTASSRKTNGNCQIIEASYGGKTTLLLSSKVDGNERLIALTVVDGFERAMFETYSRAAAPGAEIVGTYESVDAALTDARRNCPDGPISQGG